jgi:hypothetical protein
MTPYEPHMVSVSQWGMFPLPPQRRMTDRPLPPIKIIKHQKQPQPTMERFA